ncbi:lipoprotein NlpD [Variovorax boronicumulans]|uniref:murein hydrolase activator EnvC family protein n=1 Tax=Variovorax boronicumulans TaxID=436515 RepID=UPI0024752F0F|nr:M23 family metallopeptidase [Variovorax boronicumulans]MDH6165966.1 lipoprotein NlpD [Variovorax boronicumulans]
MHFKPQAQPGLPDFPFPRPLVPHRIALALASGALSILLIGCATKPAPAPAPPKKAASTKPSAAARNESSRPAPERRPRSSEPSPATPSAPVARAERNFLRPSKGTVIQRFDGRNSKGIDFAGSEGDPVIAARDGKVVYSAVGPRGYGQLVMIKHDAVFVTAYAHNSKLLVKEGQSVKRGQVIAHMGRTEADRVKLHFELRRNGNAVDPVPYLMAD